jgi:hypothetical protein
MHCPSAKTCTLAILQNAHPKAITRKTAFITSSRDTVGPLTRRLAGAACANEQRRSAAATTRLLGRQYSCQLQKPHTPFPVSLRDTLRPTAPFTQPWKRHTSLAATTNTTREYASETCKLSHLKRIISRQCRFAPCLPRGSAGGPNARAGLLLETACNIATEILGTHFNHQGKIPNKTRHIGGRRLNLIEYISHFRCSRGLKNCVVVAWLKQHHQAASVPSARSQKFAPATSAGAPTDPAD